MAKFCWWLAYNKMNIVSLVVMYGLKIVEPVERTVKGGSRPGLGQTLDSIEVR